MAAGDPIAANAERTEITPLPFSARDSWDLDTQSQEMLSTLVEATNFIPVLQEFALAIMPGPHMSEACALGVQIGARTIIEKILNMTKERMTHIKGKSLQRQAAQVGAGLPSRNQLRKPEPPVSRRLDRRIDQQHDDDPPKT